ncbi:hypothetical protein C5167_045674 [Papaver somniferum]|uniref:Uncharacterized protein n=1 Tax=Papaver somniferum TaxID=3469 RepID=A0A4Y7LF14_PAPSO|nr:hypothetical protein C5167_045674 [Papaver somniferum]
MCEGGDLDAADGLNLLDVVVRILSNQLSSLMWIDEKVGTHNHHSFYLSPVIVITQGLYYLLPLITRSLYY